MALSTYQTYLMDAEKSTPEKLVDITDYPDMGSDPNLLKTTTLSDKMETNIFGVITNEGLVFNTNYDWTIYKTLKTIENGGAKKKYALWIGADDQENPDGHDGKFEWEGYLHVHLTGGGVNEVRGMRILIANSTVVKEVQ